MTLSFSFTFDVVFVVAAVAGILALIDGILRVRGRAAVLAVIEIIVAALFLLSLFVRGIPFGSLVLALATIVVLVLQLVIRGSRSRAGVALAIISAVLLAVWVGLSQGWILIPGVNA